MKRCQRKKNKKNIYNDLSIPSDDSKNEEEDSNEDISDEEDNTIKSTREKKKSNMSNDVFFEEEIYIFIFLELRLISLFGITVDAEAVCIGNFWMQFWRKQFFYC